MCAHLGKKRGVNPGTHTYMTPTLWQARERQGLHPGVHTPAGDNDSLSLYIYTHTYKQYNNTFF